MKPDPGPPFPRSASLHTGYVSLQETNCCSIKGGKNVDKQTFEKGVEIRKSVLGKEYVENALKSADEFSKPFQEFMTEYCWGAVWGREELPKKTRSLLNLAMLGALNKEHELKLHIGGALRNGVTKEEIREVFIQLAIYAGVPAAVVAFRCAREVFAAEGKK
jgi:4-carboxymuconolactone decarboxylase